MTSRGKNIFKSCFISGGIWALLLANFVLASCADSTVGVAPDAERIVSDMRESSDMRPTDILDIVQEEPKFCQPARVVCEGMDHIKTCNTGGSKFVTSPCPTGEECTDGKCHLPKICEPGQKMCSDPKTIAICRGSGEAWSAKNCTGDEACLAGKCVSGKANGFACMSNDDCASQTCHCGSEENCGFSGDGICVQKGCTPDCGAGFCVDGAKMFADRTIGYDFCAQKCQGACDSSAQKCVELPAKTGFESSCYFKELAGIGETCSTNASCVGDICRTDYFRESNLCTRTCDENHSCPGSTACVSLNGIFQCIAKCGNGSTSGTEPCPLDLPTDRFDVTCKNKKTASGTLLRVCATPE